MKYRIKEISILFLVLIFIFFSTTSFKFFRVDKERGFRPLHFQKELKSVNNGQPYHCQGRHYAPDQILVKFKPKVTAPFVEATISAYQAKKIRRIPKIDVFLLQIPKGITVEEMLYVLKQNPNIEFAEPNYKAYIAVTPNDTLFGFQYALYNSGQEIGESPESPRGTPNADIKATSAWEEIKGDEEIVIAVIDTGVDMEHPDLINKIHSEGYDFVNDDNDATDDQAHGTFVAGIAAAETNNNKGVAGVAWNCKILPIKSIDEEGEGTYEWIEQGIIWAAENGADVINLSLGGPVPSQSLEAALTHAFGKDIVIVAAAGNEETEVLYPAAYDDYCLAVAATDYDDLRVEWSNFGPEVDVAAPGERVVGPVPTWFWGPDSFPYGFWGGTSMSTPHVAGLAALIKSMKPWLKAADIMNVIRYSADDVNGTDYPGKDNFIGYGRINMEKALVPIKITSSK